MKPIKINGIDAEIADLFLGTESLQQEGNPSRYELGAIPQSKLNALGTKMYCTVRFGQGFPVYEGMKMEFQYDAAVSTEKIGIDRTPQKVSETFAVRPPYFSQPIKVMGNHILTVNVSRKYKIGKVIPWIGYMGATEIPYTIVPPAQVND